MNRNSAFSHGPARVLTRLALAALLCSSGAVQAQAWRWVDPMIGSDNAGNVAVGPSRPFGMVKPGPDLLACVPGAARCLHSNSGHVTDLAVPLRGFGQTHVSGTGGGAKYGNIAVMPFTGALDKVGHPARRLDERAELGRYGTRLDGGLAVDITASNRVAFYRFGFPRTAQAAVEIDAGAMLSAAAEGTVDPTEAQHLVGSEIEVVGARAVRGYGRVRGGWNGGGAYTVYFHAEFERPFVRFATAQDGRVQLGVRTQADRGAAAAALLGFGAGHEQLQMKVAISFVSAARAEASMRAEIPGWSFDAVLDDTRRAWEAQLSKVQVDPGASKRDKRMFYTALYHSMLMPVDRTGENPLWHSGEPYYDDYYALWDTFRTTHPLVTLLDPVRQAGMVRSLIDIYRHDGYLPDARSGNANGRTQGGANASIVIADAYVKKLPGIDWQAALAAMVKDAEVPPGGNEEKEGRGGLADYNALGYVSSRFARAGTRTVEYAYNDFAIATVAAGLGQGELARRHAARSSSWMNLWRDVSSHGARGFIMPRDAEGRWVDTIVCPAQNGKRRPYAPTDIDQGACVCWWCGFLYEGSSWEYSLYVPHDVAGLVGRAGGPAAFQARLDTLFARKLYNVANEPSFLTPNLYHWIGRPDLSSERIDAIIDTHYHDGPGGLPGNDDGGAMSAWLAFHMLGLFPNAGQSYYLINAPRFAQARLALPDGGAFEIRTSGWSPGHRHIVAARLNGVALERAWIEHGEIVAGGVLELVMGDAPSSWGSRALPPSRRLPALP